MISLVGNNLTAGYGGVDIIQNITLEVNQGEIAVIVGPNGAGKSTMMKILSGYISQSIGTVKICDININDNPLEAKKKIGYLYLLTPLGITNKTKLTISFMQRKMEEYDELKKEIQKKQ